MKDKELTFKVYYDTEDKWYTASCVEETIITQARTFESLEKNIREAVEVHFREEFESKKFSPVISLNYTLPVYA